MAIVFSLFVLFMLWGKVVSDVLVKREVLPSTWMLLIAGISYGLFPVGYLLGAFQGSEPFYQFASFDRSSSEHFRASLITFVFFVFFFLGAGIGVRSPFIVFAATMEKKQYPLVFWVVFLFASACYLLFFYAYGGIGYVLENISQIRSGVDDRKSYVGAFFRMFTYYYEFLLISLYCFIVRASVSQRNANMFVIKFLFGVLFLFTFCKAFLDGGRGGVIFVLLGLYFASIAMRGRIVVGVKFVFLVLFSVVVVIYGKTVFFQVFASTQLAVESHSFFQVVVKVLEEFSFQYLSLVNTYYMRYEGERFFGDFIYWFMKFMRFLDVEYPDSVSYFNTFIITGDWKSDIPPGAVAFSVQQGGDLFVAVYGLICGIVFHCLDDFYRQSAACKDPLVVAYLIFVLTKSSMMILNSDFALIVQRFFVFVVLFICLWAFHVFRIKRRPRYNFCSGFLWRLVRRRGT